MKKSFKELIGSATALSLMSTLALPVAAQDLTQLSLRLAFTAGGIDAPTFVADCQGYFAEEGLAIEIVDGTGSTGTIQAIGNGSFDIGHAGLGALTQASATAGFDNIIAIAGLVQKDPSSIIALKGSGITEPKDIEGKRFATEAGNLSDGMIMAFAEANDIDMDTVELIVTDVYQTALLRGDADFINAWANPDGDHVAEFAEIEEPILFADHGVNVLGTSVIVRTDFLENHEEEMRGFLRAYTKAHADVQADPEAALACFMEHRPDYNAEAIAREIEVMERYRKTENSMDLPFGHVHPDDLLLTIELLEQYGDIPVGVADADALYTDVYLPALEE